MTVHMIYLAVGLGMSLTTVAALASGVQPPSFDLQAQPINTVVALYYKEVVKRPYVICNDVIQDSRLVSIRASGKSLDTAMLAGLLESNGYEAREDRGIAVVCTKRAAAEVQDYEPFIYKVQSRDSAYLVDLLSPLVHGTFANKRAAVQSLAVGGDKVAASGGAVAQGVVSPPQIASAASPSMRPNTGDDYIIFTGPEREQMKLRKLLAQIDVPTGEVMLKAYVYEVGKTKNDGSAVDLVASLLKSKLSISLASGVTLPNVVTFKSGGIDVVASALNSDSRFKVVTSPSARVVSGATARFTVGADVPVLTSIVTNGVGQSQQSVEMRSSGTLLEVSPRVRDKSTEVDLFEQISSFVKTETGVNSTPTLNKRELRTKLTMEDGEVIVIGGLNDTKEQDDKTGLWFLPFATSKSSSGSSSELLLILELKRI